jgi:hypothetical protein
MMRDDRRWNGSLWPRRADRDEPVCRWILVLIQHRAAVLAVAAAARWKAGIGILREREQRRNQRKREGREQQDGEQASHETGMALVYAHKWFIGEVPVRL